MLLVLMMLVVVVTVSDNVTMLVTMLVKMVVVEAAVMSTVAVAFQTSLPSMWCGWKSPSLHRAANKQQYDLAALGRWSVHFRSFASLE